MLPSAIKFKVMTIRRYDRPLFRTESNASDEYIDNTMVCSKSANLQIKEDEIMAKRNLKVLVFAFAVAAVSTNANAQSTLQEDIDAGAVPLTTSEISTTFTNNTQSGVGASWHAYYMEDGKRVILYNGKKTKRKWNVDPKKGFCTTRVRDKKRDCRIVYRIGQDVYRVYDKKGKADHTFKVEQGDTQNLK